jgi:two-component system response regulator LytT
MIREDGEELLLNVADIIYFEAQNQYIMIYTTEGEHLVRYNIGDFEEQLKSDGFFRIHRGYLISLAKVKKLVKSEVLMETATGEISLPVSRSNVKPLKETLYAYVENTAF